MNSLPFLNGFCYFEVGYILKSVIYPNLYHMALHMSKVVDIAPDIELKAKLIFTQKELTKSLVAIELLLNERPSSVESGDGLKTDEEKKTDEKKLASYQKTEADIREEEEAAAAEAEEKALAKKKKEGLAHLDKYNAVENEILDAYKHVVAYRKETTLEFLKERGEKKKEEEKSISCFWKCVRLLRTLFIFAVVCAIIGPICYSLYQTHGLE